MKKTTNLLFILLIISFSFIINVSAKDEETRYCKYNIDTSNVKEKEKVPNITVNIYDNHGTAGLTSTGSTEYDVATGLLQTKSFYSNGKFTNCPDAIFGQITTINGKMGVKISTSKPTGFSSAISFPLKSTSSTAKVGDAATLGTTSTTTCEGMLGDLKPDLENILKIMRIAAPLLIIVLSTWDYISAIFSKDADELKKASNNLLKRGILALLLFFLPIILNLVLSFVDEAYTTCIG